MSNPELPPNAIGQGTKHGVGVVGLSAVIEPTIDGVSESILTRVQGGTIDRSLAEAALDYTEMASDALVNRRNPSRAEESVSLQRLNFIAHDLPQGGTLFVLMSQHRNKSPQISYEELQALGVNKKWLNQEVWAASLNNEDLLAGEYARSKQIIIPFPAEEDMTSDMILLSALDAHSEGFITEAQLQGITDFITLRELKPTGGIEPIPVQAVFKKNNEVVMGCGLLITYPVEGRDE